MSRYALVALLLLGFTPRADALGGKDANGKVSRIETKSGDRPRVAVFGASGKDAAKHRAAVARLNNMEGQGFVVTTAGAPVDLSKIAEHAAPVPAGETVGFTGPRSIGKPAVFGKADAKDRALHGLAAKLGRRLAAKALVMKAGNLP
jgi:hypothetical protein